MRSTHNFAVLVWLVASVMACTSSDPTVDSGGPDTGNDPCAMFTACDSCSGRFTCGWCGATNRCATGNEVGPVGGTCASGWAWTYPMCPGFDGGAPEKNCAPATDCASCTAVGTCGWCSTTNHCWAGTADGPTGADCPAASWSWTGDRCAGSDAGATD